jgi:hypothetical protein
MDETDVFQRMISFDDARLAEVFAREILGFLVGRELLSPEWAERLLSWRHTGFSVHSRVRAKHRSATGIIFFTGWKVLIPCFL